MLIGSHIRERELRVLRPEEVLAGSDCLQIVVYRPIAGQNQMIAIVDYAFERWIVVGTAASARGSRRLDDLDALASGRQHHGGGKPGEAGADNIHPAPCHPAKPWRSTVSRSRPRPNRTRVRGGAQPTCSIFA